MAVGYPLYAIWAWWFGYRTDYWLYLCLVYDFSINRDCHVNEWAREVDEQTAPDPLPCMWEDMAMVAQDSMPRVSSLMIQP